MFLLVAALELIIANFVEPWLYGAYVGISSLALLVSAVFWSVLWGPAGLILSTPLTVCVVVLGRHVPQFSFLHILLGDEPVLADEAQIYQRLLAMDQPEAHSIVGPASQGETPNRVVRLGAHPGFEPGRTGPAQRSHRRSQGRVPLSQHQRDDCRVLRVSTRDSSSEEGSASGPDATEHSDGRILCLPASDRADETTAAMLAQLLEHNGLATLSFPLVGASLKEWIASIEAGPDDIACISALPPYAFAPARAMCKQIRERFPKLRVIVCVWGFVGDTHQAMARFGRTPPDYLATSLPEAVEHIKQLGRSNPKTTSLVA